MILSSDYVKARIRKGATYAAVLSVKAAASQPVSRLESFCWTGTEF